jgi:hypothetical protein
MVKSTRLIIILSVFSIGFFSWEPVFGEGSVSTQPYPVATILGKTIMSDGLVPHIRIQETMKQQLEGEKFNEWYIQYQAQGLMGKILKILMEIYAKEHNITATEEESEAFNSYLDRSLEEIKIQNEKTRQDILKELQSPTTAEERKKVISEHLATLDSLRQNEEKMEKYLQGEDARKKWKEVRRKNGEAVVRQWKINKALYEQYGGKIIFQQAGLEPVEAFGKFLRENEKKEIFQILDPELKKNFYYYFEMPHMEMPEEIARFYFEKPYWQRTNEEMESAGLKETSH